MKLAINSGGARVEVGRSCPARRRSSPWRARCRRCRARQRGPHARVGAGDRDEGARPPCRWRRPACPPVAEPRGQPVGGDRPRPARVRRRPCLRRCGGSRHQWLRPVRASSCNSARSPRSPTPRLPRHGAQPGLEPGQAFRIVRRWRTFPSPCRSLRHGRGGARCPSAWATCSSSSPSWWCADRRTAPGLQQRLSIFARPRAAPIIRRSHSVSPGFPMRFLIAVLVSLFSLSRSRRRYRPPLAAKAWALVDHATGRTLAEKDADARIEPASLTKLMTAYITFSKLKEGSLRSPTRWCRSPPRPGAWKARACSSSPTSRSVWMSSSAA